MIFFMSAPRLPTWRQRRRVDRRVDRVRYRIDIGHADDDRPAAVPAATVPAATVPAATTTVAVPAAPTTAMPASPTTAMPASTTMAVAAAVMSNGRESD